MELTTPAAAHDTPMPSRSPTALMIAAIALSGCATSVPIYTRPDDAAVVISHPNRVLRQDVPRELGRTPILLQEQAWFWTRHTLTLTKPGYRPETVLLQPHPRLVNGLGCCLLGGVFGWPLVLMGEYRGEVIVNLVPLQQQDEAEATPAPLLEEGPALSFAPVPKPRSAP